MNPGLRSSLVVVAALAALAALSPVALVGCSSSSTQSAEAAAQVASGAVLIDVRTPEEFAGGHLDGALNIDVQSADFDARITELDPAGTYLIYCRSGNRSAAAIETMEGLGFTNLSDLGSLSEAADATGVAIVR
jgi:rhodanese-related sulfurtransferase